MTSRLGRFAGLGVVALTGLLAMGVRTLGSGDRQAPAPEIEEVPCALILSVEGKDNFDEYCAVCHGLDAKGHGPAAPALKVPVPDLTRLAMREGGEFDFVAVEYIVRGRGKLATPAHGTHDMPIWGQIFRPGTGSDAAATLRIKNLVRYLESIQQGS
jgi:hypothetical protein